MFLFATFQSIILFEVGTLVPGSDYRSDMIGDLVQNIRFIFSEPFFRDMTYFDTERLTKDVSFSSGIIEPFLNVHKTFIFRRLSAKSHSIVFRNAENVFYPVGRKNLTC